MILVNGIETDGVSPLDRGLMYGDGVFRTLSVRGGAAVCWDLHHAKLAADCAALRIACPSRECLSAELGMISAREPDCVVKIIVTRGPGVRGYAVSASQQPTRIVLSSPLPRYPRSYVEVGVKLRVCTTRLCHQPMLAGVKHLNRLENVLARMEWADADTAEGLMLDVDGNVIEGTMSNIFMLKGAVLYTPDLARCGVAGVQRQRIMALAPRLGLQVSVQNSPLEFLIQADEVMLCNSLIGVWPVSEFAGKTWARSDLAGRIGRMLHAAND